MLLLVKSEVAQSCPTLCDPVDCSLLGSSFQGILQARILEWVAISFSRGAPQPRDRTQVSRIAGRRFNLWSTREVSKVQQKTCLLGEQRSRASSILTLSWRILDEPPGWKVVAEPRKILGFLASGGEEFNPGPEMRLDHSELLCNRVLLKYKGDRESFWHRHQKGAERVPPR